VRNLRGVLSVCEADDGGQQRKIRLVLRYAPFHRGSDTIVAALEASRRQGKFWPAWRPC
jgi:hypothetical protein